MHRELGLTIDEATVLIGLLDGRWRDGPHGAELAAMAHRYEAMLDKRVMTVDDPDPSPSVLAARVEAARHDSRRLGAELTEVIARSRDLAAERDGLLAAVREALSVLGGSGPLDARPADDAVLVDLRARLRAVDAA
jgi:hypothetical protein